MLHGPKTACHKTGIRRTGLPSKCWIILIEGALVIYSTELNLIPKQRMKHSLALSDLFVCFMFFIDLY